MNRSTTYQNSIGSLLKHGFSKAKLHWRELGFMYICQLVLSAIVGVVMYTILNTHIGQSAELEKLANGFNRSVFMDMIYQNDGVFSPVFSLGSIILIVYILSLLLLKGGYLTNVRKQEVGIMPMIKNGLKNYLPFLGYSIFSLIVLVVLSLLVIIPFQKIVGDPLVTFYSEKPFVWSVIGISIIVLLITTLIYGFSALCKYGFLAKKSFGAGLIFAFSAIKSNVFKILRVMVTLVSLHIAIGYLYYIVMCDRGASSWVVVILSIVIQQMFAMIRVFLGGVGIAIFDKIN